jgi:hypothetical protein
MNDDSLVISFSTDRSAADAFAAITDVRSWWTGDIDGPTDQLGAEFTYRYGDMHRSTQRITELVPGRRVAWHVTDAYLSFVTDKGEWAGTDIIFDIVPAAAGSEVRFTHAGLVPQQECFDSCSPAWQHYIGTSLRERIASRSMTPDNATATD